MEATTISDNVLMQAQEVIDEALKDPRISRKDRAVLEVQNYFLMFLKHDHRKVSEMYEHYVAERTRREKKEKDDEWLRKQVFGTATVAFIMLIINGVLFMLSTLPIIREIISMISP